MAATVSSFVLCPYGLWPTSDMLRIWEVPIFSSDLKAGCLERRSVCLFLTFRQMLDGTSKGAMNVVTSFQIHCAIIVSFDAVKLGLTRSR
jgi:hypothetical protein